MDAPRKKFLGTCQVPDQLLAQIQQVSFSFPLIPLKWIGWQPTSNFILDRYLLNDQTTYKIANCVMTDIFKFQQD